MAAMIITEYALDPDLGKTLFRTMFMHNTAITVLSRNLTTNHWALVSWNDHAHFADY